MTPLDVQDHRVKRLQELLDQKFHGKKVELGRALGHKTGAFVRQLIDRERPITEKTVAAIHALPGCHGWMDIPLDAVIPTVLPGFTPGEAKKDADRWRMSLADDPAFGQPDVLVITKPLKVGHLLQAISRVTRAVPEERRKAIQSLASATEITDADAAVIDTLAGGASVEVAPALASEVDRAFREAFYSVLDAMQNPAGRAVVNELRDAIEHKVAEALRLDINQARRALNARQSEQG